MKVIKGVWLIRHHWSDVLISGLGLGLLTRFTNSNAFMRFNLIFLHQNRFVVAWWEFCWLRLIFGAAALGKWVNSVLLIELVQHQQIKEICTKRKWFLFWLALIGVRWSRRRFICITWRSYPLGITSIAYFLSGQIISHSKFWLQLCA